MRRSTKMCITNLEKSKGTSQGGEDSHPNGKKCSLDTVILARPVKREEVRREVPRIACRGQQGRPAPKKEKPSNKKTQTREEEKKGDWHGLAALREKVGKVSA